MAYRHTQLGLAIFNVESGRLRRLNHRPGKIFWKKTLRRAGKAKHALATNCDPHFCGACIQFDSVLKFLNTLHASDVLPARCSGADAADRAEEQADCGPT